MTEPPPNQPPPNQPPPPASTDRTDVVDPLLGSHDAWLEEPCPARPVRRPDYERVGGVVLAAGVGAAIFGNVALRADVTNVAAFSAVALTGLALFASGSATRRHTKLMILSAVVLAAWLPVRASSWLAHLNSWTAVALLCCAALFDGTSPPRLSFDFAKKVTARLFESRWAGVLIATSSKPSSSHFRNAVLPVLRGVALAAIPVAVLGAILSSADAVFASTISFGWEPGALIGHILLTGVIGFAVFGLICISSADDEYPVEQPRPIGAIESLIVLSSIAVLYGFFAVIQMLGAFGVTDHILEEQGVTLKDYAREGFFQLLVVAGLTLLLLTTLQALTGKPAPRSARADVERPDPRSQPVSSTGKPAPRSARADVERPDPRSQPVSSTGKPARLHHAQAIVGAVVSLLTVVIVAVSISRIHLYTEGFGQTTLRWYSSAFAWMLGLLFILFALQHLVPRNRSWVGWSAAAVVLTTLLAVNVLNPEARIAEHNLTHLPSAQGIDAEYVTRLSADAWPAILERRELVSALLEERMASGSRHIPTDWDRPADQSWIEWRCERADRGGGYGPFGFNLARSHLTC